MIYQRHVYKVKNITLLLLLVLNSAVKAWEITINNQATVPVTVQIDSSQSQPKWKDRCVNWGLGNYSGCLESNRCGWGAGDGHEWMSGPGQVPAKTSHTFDYADLSGLCIGSCTTSVSITSPGLPPASYSTDIMPIGMVVVSSLAFFGAGAMIIAGEQCKSFNFTVKEISTQPVSAVYGNITSQTSVMCLDVTQQVQALAGTNLSGDFIQKLGIVDPAPGVVKYLEIKYPLRAETIADKRYIDVTAVEYHDTMIIKDGSGTTIDGRVAIIPKVILSAHYGDCVAAIDGKTSHDVLKEFQEGLASGHVVASGDAFGIKNAEAPHAVTAAAAAAVAEVPQVAVVAGVPAIAVAKKTAPKKAAASTKSPNSKQVKSAKKVVKTVASKTSAVANAPVAQADSLKPSVGEVTSQQAVKYLQIKYSKDSKNENTLWSWDGEMVKSLPIMGLVFGPS